jgi:predicted molibdopterin-dependent oxidoreductase YjgC
VSGVRVWVDGEAIVAPAGRSVGAVLLERGRRGLRHSPRGGPRGLYCGIGACHECRVRVEGRGAVRACVTPVQDGMRITTEVR